MGKKLSWRPVNPSFTGQKLMRGHIRRAITSPHIYQYIRLQKQWYGDVLIMGSL